MAASRDLKANGKSVGSEPRRNGNGRIPAGVGKHAEWLDAGLACVASVDDLQRREMGIIGLATCRRRDEQIMLAKENRNLVVQLLDPLPRRLEIDFSPALADAIQEKLGHVRQPII